jgi:hypothetical protein
MRGNEDHERKGAKFYPQTLGRKVISDKRKEKIPFSTNAQFFTLVSLLTSSKLRLSQYAFEANKSTQRLLNYPY